MTKAKRAMLYGPCFPEEAVGLQKYTDKHTHTHTLSTHTHSTHTHSHTHTDDQTILPLRACFWTGSPERYTPEFKRRQKNIRRTPTTSERLHAPNLKTSKGPFLLEDKEQLKTSEDPLAEDIEGHVPGVMSLTLRASTILCRS